MPTKTTGKGLQQATSRVWYLKNPDKPRPRGTCNEGGEDARKNLFIYESQFYLLTILMDSQVSKSMF